MKPFDFKSMKVAIVIDQPFHSGGGSVAVNAIIQKIKLMSAKNSTINFTILDFSRTVFINQQTNIATLNFRETLFDKIIRKIGKLIFYKLAFYNLGEVLFGLHIFNRVKKKKGFDLVFFTSPSKLTFVNINLPQITTVWDFGHLEYPALPEYKKTKVFFQRQDFLKYNLARSFMILTESEHNKAKIRNNFGIDDNKIRVVEFSDNIDVHTKYIANKPSKEKFFFYPAQFWAHKNHIQILEATELFVEKYRKDIKIVFTGEEKGNYAFIQSLIKKKGLEDKIECLGFVTREKVYNLYSQCIGVLFLSILGPSNIPPLEAKLFGKELVVLDLNFNRELLSDGDTHFVEFGNAEQLADKMNEILNKKTKTKTKQPQRIQKNNMLEIFEEFINFRKLSED